MWWRIKRSELDKQKREGNKKALKEIIRRGEVPGLIAYFEDEPIAWCSVAPREIFPALERSQILKRIDNEPVWPIVCFFVAKPYRKKGVSLDLLRTTIEYAQREGAQIIEGYPIDPKKKSTPDIFVFTGLYSTF